MIYKKCSECGILKPLNEFHKQKGRKYDRRSNCKKCVSEHGKIYRQIYSEEISIRKGCIPLGKNKFCASYLGVVIGERLCRHLFKDVEVMPYGHSGYDIICNKGKKIDVKAAYVSLNHGNSVWSFRIKHNKIADFFILVAFDNRTDLNPLHLWMIPGKEINKNSGKSIRPSTLHKWSQWEKDIDSVKLCCNDLRLNRSNYT